MNKKIKTNKLYQNVFMKIRAKCIGEYAKNKQCVKNKLNIYISSYFSQSTSVCWDAAPYISQLAIDDILKWYDDVSMKNYIWNYLNFIAQKLSKFLCKRRNQK